MKRIISLIALVVMVSPIVSCEQVGGLFGKKTTEQQKMEEIAAKAAEMIAAQQKKAADEKAKLDQQVEAEVQKRLAEEKAKTVEAQQTTQPTVIEKIIIKDSKAPATAGTAEAKPTGYLRIYVDKGLGGGAMTIPFGRNISTTNGTAFKDNCSSASYKIPAGWQVAIYA